MFVYHILYSHIVCRIRSFWCEFHTHTHKKPQNKLIAPPDAQAKPTHNKAGGYWWQFRSYRIFRAYNNHAAWHAALHCTHKHTNKTTQYTIICDDDDDAVNIRNLFVRALHIYFLFASTSASPPPPLNKPPPAAVRRRRCML